MSIFDDLDDDLVDPEEQSQADQLRAVLWCLALAVFFGGLIWLAWAGV